MLKFLVPNPTKVEKPSLADALRDDVFAGTPSNDQYFGNEGNDRMLGSAGDDVFDGGAGVDLVDYSNSAQGVNVNLTRGTGWSGDAAGDVYTSVENITGSAFNDLLVGNADDNWIFGGDGDDNLSGRAGNDSLYGADGDDIIEGGSGADLLSGGAGVDTVSYLHSNAGVSVNLADGTGSGGDAQGDKLIGFENIQGSFHNDTLTGDSGNNVIDGSRGDDIISGGAGADTFVFQNQDNVQHGNDLITDFEISDGDLLDLSKTQYDSYAALEADGRIVQNGNNTVIYTEKNSSFTGDSITLENVNASDLDASSFIF